MLGNEENPVLHYDFRGYLAKKAEEAGCILLPERYTVDADSMTFLLKHPSAKIEGHAAISISGLEEIQNSSRVAVQNLLDSRFGNALNTLQDGIAHFEKMETGGDNGGS
jgi:hypothetical protein